MDTAITDDCRVDTPQGRLFARRWTAPESLAGAAPILLFHDSLGCVALWRDFPQQLAAATRRQVIAYDRLGFGASDPRSELPDDDFTRAEAHAALPALRAAFGIGRFIAFGHSVGGAMAVACAAAEVTDCGALITESAQSFVEPHTLAGIREAEQAFAQPEQLERLRRHHGDKAAWVLRAWTRRWLAPSFAAWNLDADLRRVRCPLLVLHGDRDEYGSIRHPERIAQFAAGRCEVRILPDCGHVPHREQPATVLAHLGEWLTETPVD